MKLQHLRYFTAVVDHGGVTRASERLRMTQPSVSAGLKLLEQDIGCALFERGGGGMRLTQAGARFYRRAVDILRQCDLAKAEARGDDGPVSLRLGIMNTLTERILAAVSTTILHRRETTRITFRIGAPERVASWMRQGRIDVAIMPQDEAPQTEGAELLYSEPFVCLAPRSHPFATGGTIRMAELAGQPFVLRGHCERRRAAQTLFRTERMPLNVTAIADSDADALALVRHGVGVTLAPVSLGGGDLCTIEVADLALDRGVGLFWRAEIPDDWIETIASAVRDGHASTGRAG